MTNISLCEKIKLARKHSGTPEYRDYFLMELIKELSPVIEALAAKYLCKLEQVTLEDLQQEAYVIVLESVETYVLIEETDETYLDYLKNKISRCYEMFGLRESLRKRYGDLENL